MLRRGIWVAGAASHVATKSGWSAEPLEVLTADVRPLSIADGPRRGIVLDIVREALSSVGHEAHFTFLPFAEALQKTQARAGTLMAPLARSPQREQNFAWIAKVVDVPQANALMRTPKATEHRPSYDNEFSSGVTRHSRSREIAVSAEFGAPA